MKKLVVGRAAFVDDVTPDGLLHAAVVPSPHDHARVLTLDTASARAATGVVAVVSHAEGAGEPALPDDRGRRALFTGVASYRGAPIALVAAEDPEIALRAADLVRGAYEPLPVVSFAAVAGEGSPAAASLVLETGERGPAEKDADLVVEARRSGERTHPGPAEPPVALTWLDEDGLLVVRSSTASPLRLRRILADMLGVSGGRIRIERPEVGGDFGAREGSFLEVACAVLTLRTGRPVRLALRLDDPAGRWDRPAWRATAKGSLRHRELVAVDLALTQECGAAAHAADLEAELRRAASVRDLYRFAAFRFSGRAVLTHAPPASGAAPTGATLALEGLMDAAADALGEDRLAFRKRHLGGGAGLRPAFLALERAAPQSSPPAATRAADASAAWGTALCRLPLRPARAQASVACNEDGSYTLSWSPCEFGTAVAVGLEELVARKLGVPPEQVATSHGSAADAPAEAVADPWLTARAVGLAADEMGRKQRRATRQKAGMVTRGEAMSDEAPVPLGAFFARVSLDPETGLLTLHRLVQVLATGSAEPSVLARAEGDALRGAGLALFEASAAGARGVRAGDVPPPETAMVTPGKRGGPAGLPLGDIAFSGAAAAIVSAVARILGSDGGEIALPLSPERTLAVLRGKAASR